MTFPRRGEIYWVNLDPTMGTEIAKTRPAIIISNDIGNEHSARLIVAPITSSNTAKVYPFEVSIASGEGGLSQASKVVLDQIRALDKQRLGQRLGSLSGERMREVDSAIRRSLAL
ncbi:MAG TPA: type II toxin-antitoxin system PemK/MazF family toxin [Chloroflexota bacterium]|jgi:mRNA interferase MazF|nr:type II toxin-antitoxin system PemK/MazF family toxin [Chloroflexota bacterium]